MTPPRVLPFEPKKTKPVLVPPTPTPTPSTSGLQITVVVSRPGDPPKDSA